MRSFAQLSALAAALGAVLSCLPADERPPPGSLALTVSPAPAVRDGFATVDGWTLSFDRVVVGIGHASLGDGCVTYSDARYDRVLDVKQGPAQKLSILYGLGACDVRFRITPPEEDAVLGQGVPEDVKTLMRTPATDAYVPGGGISLLVDGSAAREGDLVTFHWSFRQTYSYDHCAVVVNGVPEPGVNLTGNAALTYDIQIGAERLFLDDLAETAELRFDPFASADQSLGDADGDVTLAELVAVKLEQVREIAPYGVADQDQAHVVNTLQDYVYLLLFPRVPGFRGDGRCAPVVGERKGGHGPMSNR